MSKLTKVLLAYPIPSISSPQKSNPLSILHVGRALSEAKTRGRSTEDYDVRYWDGRYDEWPDMDWPDIVGCSTMTGYQIKGAIKILQDAKAHGKKTVLGGIHPTMQADQCLQERYVDSVVVGEGEWAIIDAIHSGPKSKICAPNLRTEDMVSPVAPDTLEHFWRSSKSGDTMLMASRGCPYSCSFCLDGDTLVMLSDLTWTAIRNISEGDEVVGVKKAGYGNNIVRTKVLATSSRVADTYEIMTDRGAVIATAEHPWLAHANHSRWRKTIALKPGDKIRWLTEPVDSQLQGESNDYRVGYMAGANTGDGYTGQYRYPGMSEQNHFGLVGDDEMLDTFMEYSGKVGLEVVEANYNGGKTFPNVTRMVRTHARQSVAFVENISRDDDRTIEYKRGFLSGFFDADGSTDKNVVKFHNLDVSVSMRVASYLSEFGFEVAVMFLHGRHVGVRLTGGSSEKIRFFSIARPKVVHKAPVFDLGLGQDFAVVMSVTPAGNREVFDIQTDAESFIANGLVSHNCYIVPFFHNKKGEIWWAKVDLDQWKSDILYLKKTIGIKEMAHGDDWVGPADRLFEILEFLKSNGIHYRPSIRAHQIDDDVARRLKELGVENLSIGIETASPRILDLVHKGNDLDDLHQCVESLAKYKLWPLLYYISGFPSETQEEINQTLDFADWAYKQFNGRVTQNFYAWVPLPGNPLWDMIDKSTLPQTMEAWSNFSLNQTYNKQASNLYHVAGLTFHRTAGDKTDKNFPGLSRLLIWPFEVLAAWRWKHRKFMYFEFEKYFIEWLLKWASLRYENKVKKTKRKVSDMDIMDWGVRLGHEGIGARGEYATGEIGHKD
jgi:radical SAM superfamily enzyme YgiQ (UPF0313 family)